MARAGGPAYVSCRGCGRGYWPDVEAETHAPAGGRLLRRLVSSTRDSGGDPRRECVFCGSAELAETSPPQITPALLGVIRSGPEESTDTEPATPATPTPALGSAFDRLRRVDIPSDRDRV